MDGFLVDYNFLSLPFYLFLLSASPLQRLQGGESGIVREESSPGRETLATQRQSVPDLPGPLLSVCLPRCGRLRVEP